MMPNVMCSGVLGVAELLLKTPLSEEQRMYLEIIKSSGDSLLRIISDVLDLSKIEAHNLALEWLPFNVKDQLKDALALLKVVAREKGLEVRKGGVMGQGSMSTMNYLISEKGKGGKEYLLDGS